MKRPHQCIRECVASPVGSPAAGAVVAEGRLQAAVPKLGLYVADLDPERKMVEEADDLRDAKMWAESQEATVVMSEDDGQTWEPVS